jgi:GTP-binding protein
LEHPKDYLWVISGEQVMNKFAMINLSTDEGVAQLISYLGRIGVDEALKEKGAKNGDTVAIGDFQFDYTE